MQMPADYIASKGFEHKVQSGQLVLRSCPFCNDEKWHFYMSPNEGGPYFCHKCNERGNLYSLKKHLGDIQDTIQPAYKKPMAQKPKPGMDERYHQALLQDQDGLDYLEGRGINLESINRFKLGLYQKNGTKWMSIPLYQGESLVNIKFRSLPPAEKTFRRIPECASVLFNLNNVKGHKEVYLTEGELDAITLSQAGIENVISGTTGAGSFDPEWIDQLKRFKKIYIVYDSDEAGQKGARAVAKRLGYNRCFNVELPDGQDPNDFFLENDIFAFQGIANQAERFALPGVISAQAAIDLLRREKTNGEATGLLTPWDNVNSLLKGFKPGDLIVLSAPPKTGKTTYALNICSALAKVGIPSLFYCLEMRPERLIKKHIQSEFRKESLEIDDIDRASRQFSGLPLYLAHAFKKLKLDAVLKLIREAIQRYDLRFIVFDNLHFLVRSVSNVNEELGQAVQGFKLLAEEMEIPIMAIAQPRKRDAGGRDEIMRADDIKYSNSVHADCDQMIILHRKRIASKAKEVNQDNFTAKTEALDPVTLVRIEAHRYGSGGEALLYFHGEYSRFDLIEKDQSQHWTERVSVNRRDNNETYPKASPVCGRIPDRPQCYPGGY